MDSNILATPTVLRSAFVAPTLGRSVAGVCPKTGSTPVEVHVQANAAATFRARKAAGMATGFRSSWSPLIT